MANLAPNGYGSSFAKTIREISGANSIELDGAPDEGLVWFSSRGGTGSNAVSNATTDIAGKVRVSTLPASGDPVAIATTDARALPTVSATIPANPVDGQMWIYRGSNFTWQFMYNASSSSSYKWEFVGGGPIHAFDTTSQTVTLGTSYTGPPTATALVYPPFAGEWMIELECTGTLSAANVVCFVTIGIGTSPETISDDNSAQVTGSASGAPVSTNRFDKVTLTTANTYVAPRWKRGATAGNITLSKHAIRATPIRVG